MIIGFNSRILIFFTLLVNFTTSSKIYIVDLSDHEDSTHEVITSNQNHNHDKGNHVNKLTRNSREKKILEKDTIVQKILRAIKEKKRKDRSDAIKIENNCKRYFRSIYTTKMEMLQCIEKLNSKNNGRTEVRRFKYPKYHSKEVLVKPRIQKYPLFKYYGRYLKADFDPFVDVTRQDMKAFSNDYLDVKDLARTGFDDKSFSSDYLDVADLARASEDFRINDDTHTEECIRRNVEKKTYLKNKTMTEYLKVRAYSDESESESSEEIRTYKPKKGYKKPKSYDFEDDASSESVSIEVEPKKNHYKNKNIRDEKYGVLQGRDILYLDNDFEVNSRKRLEHFLPKRFHWEEDEIQDLGYYWFNGPRGRYPEAMRNK